MGQFVTGQNDGEEVLSYAKSLYGSPTRTIKNIKYYFKPGITFSLTNTRGFGGRLSPEGFIFDVQGSTIFGEKKYLTIILSLLNSNVAEELMKVLSPTMVTHVGYLKKLPLILPDNLSEFDHIVNDCIKISKDDWDRSELSWNFTSNQLVNRCSREVSEAYDLYVQKWTILFKRLHANEQSLNQKLIKLYNLEDEISSEVSIGSISILKDEVISSDNSLVFDQNEVFSQLSSYSVGCMFGRFSLDKEGLILATEREGNEPNAPICSKSVIYENSFR